MSYVFGFLLICALLHNWKQHKELRRLRAYMKGLPKWVKPGLDDPGIENLYHK